MPLRTPIEPKVQILETRVVPGTELELPRLSLGTMTFGGQADEATSKEMLDMALDAGVNFLDTANVYNDGESERIVGRLLQGRRDKVILATKVGNPKMADGPALTPEQIRLWISSSLKQLQTDYIDIYYFHRPDPVTPIEESLGAAWELVDQGLVKHLAVSNYSAWQIVEMQELAKDEGRDPVRISQPVYNLLARRIEDEYTACTTHRGVLNIVYNPLAGGLLTGKHASTQNPAEGTRFSEKSTYRDRYWNQTQFDSVVALADIAKAAGLTLPQLAFRWLLAQPHVDSILLGASRPEQLRENLDACADGSLPEDVVEACDEVWERLRGAAPGYAK